MPRQRSLIVACDIVTGTKDVVLKISDGRLIRLCK